MSRHRAAPPGHEGPAWTWQTTACGWPFVDGRPTSSFSARAGRGWRSAPLQRAPMAAAALDAVGSSIRRPRTTGAARRRSKPRPSSSSCSTDRLAARPRVAEASPRCVDLGSPLATPRTRIPRAPAPPHLSVHAEHGFAMMGESRAQRAGEGMFPSSSFLFCEDVTPHPEAHSIRFRTSPVHAKHGSAMTGEVKAGSRRAQGVLPRGYRGVGKARRWGTGNVRSCGGRRLGGKLPPKLPRRHRPPG